MHCVTDVTKSCPLTSAQQAEGTEPEIPGSTYLAIISVRCRYGVSNPHRKLGLYTRLACQSCWARDLRKGCYLKSEQHTRATEPVCTDIPCLEQVNVQPSPIFAKRIWSITPPFLPSGVPQLPSFCLFTGGWNKELSGGRIWNGRSSRASA